jgi:predicted glutamine amidotransferase
MCELTFINTTNKEFNKLFLLNSLVTNSGHHTDGAGFFIPKEGVMKTHITGRYITNLGKLINDYITTSEPIIGHVRLASTIAGKTKTVTDDQAHPFESENYIFAHNGTLTLKDSKDQYSPKWDKMIDSQVFLEKLEENHSEDFVESINKTMNLFTGKFAFLIYEKQTRNFYIIRGKTAKLHQSFIKLDGKDIGYVINTEMGDLFITLNLVRNSYALNGRLMEFSEIKELPIEKIFLAEKDNIKEVGDIKENEKESFTTTTYYQKGGAASQGNFLPTSGGERTITTTGTNKSPIDNFSDKVVNFLDSYGLYLNDVDELFSIITGTGIAEAEASDLDCMSGLFNLLERKCKNNRKLVKTWEFITNKIGFSKPYLEHNIQFPYMLEDFRNIKQLLRDLKREREEK